MSRTFRRGSLAVGALLLAGLSGLALAPAQPPADQPPPAREGDLRGPGRPPGAGPRRENVESLMKTVNRSMKALRVQLDDAGKTDENLRLVGEMQRACVTAKTAGIPADVLSRGKSDEEKTRMVALFRSQLIAATRKLLDVEEDIAGGKTAGAGKKLDELIEMRKTSHEALGVKDE